MAWFKKKLPVPASLPADEQWSVATGENQGKPMLVRVNTTVKQYAGHRDMPIRLGIAIPFAAPREDGLPNEAESAQLSDIEDRLHRALGSSGRLVVILTTSGMREFVSYVGSREVAESVAQSLRAATSTHEVQFYAEADPTWELYLQFA